MGSIHAASAYTDHVGIEVEPSACGIGAVRVPEGEHLNNHVGSRHAGALFSICDSAAAALIEATFPPQLGRALAIGRERISYERMAKGPLRACARIAGDSGAAQIAAIAAGTTPSFDIDIEVTDEKDRVVVAMTIEYLVAGPVTGGSHVGHVFSSNGHHQPGGERPL